MPGFGLAMTLIWWVRRGSTARGKLHRGRSIIGVIAAMVATVYFVRTALISEAAADRGRIILPYEALAFWLALLGGLAAALVAVALLDWRRSRRSKRGQPLPDRALTVEIVTTLLWAALVVGIGAAVIAIQLRYPALR